MDDYRELGVTPESSDRQVRSAYIRLARRYHPDGGEMGDEEALKRINTAYDNIRRDREKKERLPEVDITPRTRRPLKITVASTVAFAVGLYAVLRLLLKLFF
ncbi:MAG: DnaJ domain-containing protein [Eubacteriales bacterium]|nr:DnaJ domain-containing protein [Eubacteriales bacterium]